MVAVCAVFANLSGYTSHQWTVYESILNGRCRYSHISKQNVQHRRRAMAISILCYLKMLLHSNLRRWPWCLTPVHIKFADIQPLSRLAEHKNYILIWTLLVFAQTNLLSGVSFVSSNEFLPIIQKVQFPFSSMAHTALYLFCIHSSVVIVTSISSCLTDWQKDHA